MEFSTVYPLLKKSVAMGKDIGVQDIMVVLDLAIYAKAVEVRWQKQKELNRVVIRLSAFHTAFHFITVTGKRFKCSGFKDILIESDVVVSGSKKALLRESTTTET